MLESHFVGKSEDRVSPIEAHLLTTHKLTYLHYSDTFQLLNGVFGVLGLHVVTRVGTVSSQDPGNVSMQLTVQLKDVTETVFRIKDVNK